jgi:succinyl-CoA synthetase beta subunit
LNLHEYQARALLKAAGIPMPDGDVAASPDEVQAIATRLQRPVVVKAQVHTGGRGKAGGVKLAGTPAEAREVASRILGMSIKGLVVQRVLVAPAEDIATESYVGLIMDRETQRPVFMVSAAGGVDIEEVAATTPEKITRLAVDPRYGLFPHEALTLALTLYQDFKQARAAASIMQQLYSVFTANGASLVEINPLITTPAGQVLALDAKISVDDNELDRRPDLAALRDEVRRSAERGRRPRGGADVHQARWQRRLRGEWRGARHGHDGPGEVLRRRAGQFPGHRRQLESGEGRCRAPDHHRRPRGQVDPLQHFRRDHPDRRRGRRHRGAMSQFKVSLPVVIRLTGTNEEKAFEILKGVGMRALSDMDEAVKQAVELAKGAA